jgi:fatty-acyl-CoA synthase
MSHLLTLSDNVAAHARTQPHKIGVRDSLRALTYAQLNERASRLANALLGLGLVKGDRVALLAFNTLEWLEIYAALARAGLVAVPINFRLASPEIAYIVGHAQARAIVVQEPLRGVIESIRCPSRPSASFTSVARAHRRAGKAMKHSWPRCRPRRRQ